MQLEFRKKSNSKREAIFRNRARKQLSRLVESAIAELNKDISDEGRKDLVKEMEDVVVHALRERQDVILSEEPVEVQSRQDALAEIVDKVRRQVSAEEEAKF